MLLISTASTHRYGSYGPGTHKLESVTLWSRRVVTSGALSTHTAEPKEP